MISLPLRSHRVRFKTYPFTFTTEEALQNMASLRLTQTNRMDDPKVCFFSKTNVPNLLERWPYSHHYHFDLVFHWTRNGKNNWSPVCSSTSGGSCGRRGERVVR